MKSSFSFAVVLSLLALGSSVASAGKSEISPLTNVIELMDSLAAKIVKDSEVEAKAYAKYVEYCDDAARNLKFGIRTATSRKEQLEAAIGKAAGDAEASAAKIGDLAASIASDNSELTDATVVRKKEASDFAASEAELVDAIDTLTRAINILEREMRKNPAALTQVDTTSLNSLLTSLSAVLDAAAFLSVDQHKLLALVQSQQAAEADEGLGAPAAAAYKTHSNSVFDVLEDLKEKAETQLSDLRKAEVNTRHNFEMLKQSLEDQIEADTKDMKDEKAAKAATEGDKATAEGDLASTVKDLANGQKVLEATQGNCMTMASDHEATVKARAEELAAITKAKEILATTSAGASKQSYSLLQESIAASLDSKMQTRADLANAEVVEIVKRLAREHHSAALAQLASRIAAVLRYGSAAGEDPFAKVKSLISGLIARLASEASSDATEKAFCDEEIAKTEAKKDELEFDTSKLSTKIDQAAARSAKLKAEVKELQSELAALAKQQAEMNLIRSESHASYAQAKADLETGLLGVRKAIGVLRDYYGSASAAAAMVQDSSKFEDVTQQPALPEQHEKAQGAGWSIIQTLEVVESDFARNLATEETTEVDAQAEYEKTTQENAVTKTLKDQDVKYKTQALTSLTKGIGELTADKATAGTELDAVHQYYTTIKARCIAKPETYEERRRRREAEIQGLKRALAILEGEAAFMQRGKRRSRSAFLVAGK